LKYTFLLEKLNEIRAVSQRHNIIIRVESSHDLVECGHNSVTPPILVVSLPSFFYCTIKGKKPFYIFILYIKVKSLGS